ncbi:MAG: hypothetical protein ABL903_04685 [Methylococcales bacterium]
MSFEEYLHQQPNYLHSKGYSCPPEYEPLRQVIYTPLEDAIHLLHARQQQKPAIDIPGLELPQGVTQPRTAILFRQIATPNHEMHRVVKICDTYKLNLLILTIQDDKFTTENTGKYALGRMGFYEGIGRQGGKKIRYSSIIDLNQCNGRPFQECITYRGQSLVEFHHNLLLQEFPQLSPSNIIDCSEWYRRHSRRKGNAYREMLKLFLKDAILFETFLFSGKEREFTLNKVLPAFQEIVDTYGIKPLIVHSDTHELEGDDYWQYYPEHLRSFAPYERRKIPRLAA